MRLPVKAIITILLLNGAPVVAQPVIQANMPDSGFSAPMYVGSNIPNAQGGGANVTWDFSWQSAFTQVGILEYMEIDGTEFEADFSTSNLVARKRIGGDTTYNYYTNLGNEMIIDGENMGATIFGDYSANSKQLFIFPMNYGDSLSDTWQSTVASGKVKRYYDGWGTLITNFNTFPNVVRIKTVDSFLFGATWTVNTSYTWYTTDKLIPVAHFENSSLQMTILKMFPVSVENASATNNKARLAPNPFKERATLYIEKVVPGMQLIITNALGQVIRTKAITNNSIIIDKESLYSGMYFYSIQSKEGIRATGKFVIE